MSRNVTCCGTFSLLLLLVGCEQDVEVAESNEGSAGSFDAAGGVRTAEESDIGAGGSSDTDATDLPPEFAGAEQISISQYGCNDSEVVLHTEYLVLDQPDRLTYSNAFFRCGQDLCGYALQQNNEYHVLVQPCDMDPDSVTSCGCLSDVGIPIPEGSKAVKVWRRWDYYGSQYGPSQPPPLVAIGEVEVTASVSCNNGRQDGEEVDVDCGGVGDCKRCGPGMACVDDQDCESVHCDAGQCQKA